MHINVLNGQRILPVRGVLANPNPLDFHEELAMAYHRWKSVFVRAYPRFRFGRREAVCQHWRSHPGQMQLFA